MNAMYSFTGQLAAGSRRGVEPPRLAVVIETWQPRTPLVAELEWRNGEIDAAALGRRYRSLPREGGYADEFYRDITRLLLQLIQHAAGSVIQEIAEPAVRLRCMGALETWLGSIEAMLPPTQAPTR